jgi:hypothetical protein
MYFANKDIVVEESGILKKATSMKYINCGQHIRHIAYISYVSILIKNRDCPCCAKQFPASMVK